MQLSIVKNFNGVDFECYQNEFDTGDFWGTREQIGQMLDYVDPETAITKIHQRNAERLDKFSTVTKMVRIEGGREVTRDIIVYNFKGLLEICRYSNQPKADAVMDFLWDIADEIRKTGCYSAKSDGELLSVAEQRLKIQAQANDIEAAKLLKQLLENPKFNFSEFDKIKMLEKIAKLLGYIMQPALIYPAHYLAEKLKITSKTLMKCAAVNFLLDKASNENGFYHNDIWYFTELGRERILAAINKRRG